MCIEPCICQGLHFQINRIISDPPIIFPSSSSTYPGRLHYRFTYSAVPAILEVYIGLVMDEELNNRSVSFTCSQMQGGPLVIVLYVRWNPFPQHLVQSHPVAPWCETKEIPYPLHIKVLLLGHPSWLRSMRQVKRRDWQRRSKLHRIIWFSPWRRDDHDWMTFWAGNTTMTGLDLSKLLLFSTSYLIFHICLGLSHTYMLQKLFGYSSCTLQST